MYMDKDEAKAIADQIVDFNPITLRILGDIKNYAGLSLYTMDVLLSDRDMKHKLVIVTELTWLKYEVIEKDNLLTISWK